MKTIIYYFTGTGNSLVAARTIAEVLGDCELVPIAALNSRDEIVPKADRVGIVCPVYDSGLPLLVAEFASRLDLSRTGYIFAVVTMGGIGVSALHQLNGIFRERTGRKTDAAFAIRMPGNFPPVSRIAGKEKLTATLLAAETRLKEIARTIDTGLVVPAGFSPLSALMKGITYGPFSKNARSMDRKFSVSDSCTSCGTCAGVCPVQNIKLENKKPVWQHRCELCCACLNFCPVEAIQLQMMQGTKDRGRYHHPAVKIADMKIQQGDEP